MIGTAEKVLALSTREIKVLARSRSRLVSTLAVPLTGGIVCGWMTRTTSLPPIYCLVLFLLLSAAVLAADQRTPASQALAGAAGRGVFTAAWVLSALLVLVVQTAILTTCASIIGGFQVANSILAGTVAVSLVLSTTLHRLLS